MRKQVWKSYCLDSEIVSSYYAAIERMAGWLFFFVVTFPPYFLWHSLHPCWPTCIIWCCEMSPLGFHYDFLVLCDHDMMRFREALVLGMK
jgi:hypothetical protein